MASDPLQYYIGKGIVSWTPMVSGTAGAKRDLGNVPKFELSPNVTLKDHFSSRTGTKTKDRSIVQEVAMKVTMTLEEFNVENLALAVLGTVTSNTVDLLSNTQLTGQIDFQGTNDVGAKVDITLYNVQISPTGNLGFITDDWGGIEVTGEALVVASGTNAGKVGTMTITPAA